MALDGIILYRIAEDLQTILPAKINKIQQFSDTEVLFTLRSNKQNYKLMISCHSVYNRIHLSKHAYTSADAPQNFIMVLRKHLNGAIIKSMKQIGLDRVLHFILEARNDLGDIHEIHMYVELMGKYANIILVNEEGKIIDALKRIPPFENNVRTIHPGSQFIPITPHHEKTNPFTNPNYDEEASFVKQFHGFSPLLSDEFHYRLKHGEQFDAIMEEIKTSHTMYYYEIKEKEYFHLIPLKHLNANAKTYPLEKALEEIYSQKEEKVRIKEQSGDLFKIVRQELKKNKNKLNKLESTLEDAYQLEQYRIYGDLLYAYAYQFSKKEKQVILPSFETGEDVVIPLDEKLDIKQNAKKYYQKYNKSKTAQIEVAKQIELTKDHILYFENMEMQLEQATLFDALEIREELANHGYLRKKMKVMTKKKKQRPHFMTLEIDDTLIYVGKNNLQNDYITWKHACKDDLWFHTKDIHGSHVVVANSHPSEMIIRAAAMLAAYYSKGRFSSSVPVNYCLIKQLRKPNKANLGFVTLTNYKTIYIDPEEDEIHTLLTHLKS